VKKPIFPRLISLFVVYVGIFVVLVILQFANHRSFTLKVGDFVISGNYSGRRAGVETSQGDERLLEGDAGVLYGGMEFFLTGDGGGNGLGILTGGGNRERVRPLTMTVSERSALFRLSGGAAISFNSQLNGGAQELQIRVSLPEGAQGLELPYRLLRSSRIRRGADGESHVIAGGKSYRFNESTVDYARRLVILDSGEPAAFYGAVPEAEVIDPSRFVLSAARDRRHYGEALDRWRDQAFSRWALSAGGNPDEETVLAYLAESLSRGSYQAAVAAISPGFTGGTQRGFMSSAYLGRTDQGLRSSLAFERENFSRLSRLIADGSADFLKDIHVIEFLAVRGYDSLIDSGAGIVNALKGADPDMDPDPGLIPGILEGYMDWLSCRPNAENPFERMADQACFFLSEKIVAGYQGERILVFDRGQADLEYNCRVGAALTAYGEYTGQEVWAGIGRSLVLSVLAFLDEAGTAPLTLSLAADGGIEAAPAAAQGAAQSGVPGSALSSARIYRLLRLGDYSARAIGLHAAANGVWTWTAASAVTASFNHENNMLDLTVVFPRGETHYMFIRGVRPFTQIQLYNIPYRTDPRFESYDSSGWTYSPSEQTLMVKMKHQLPTEHIQIFY
jgi:hypothetical protein